MKNFKTIVKFTIKDVFFRKAFLITNIIMMFVVIFLSRMIIKIGSITENFMASETNSLKTETYDEQNQNNNEKEYENVNANNLNSDIKSQVVSKLNGTLNAGFIISFILFFSIYFYGYMVSNQIAGEKTSRVLETLVVSTSPESIVLGKTVAMGILGIGQMFFLLIVAILSFADKINFSSISKLNLNFNLNNFDFSRISNIFSNMNISFSGTTLTNIINVINIILIPLIILLFFIFGYAFYAFICAIAGAGINKAEDIQIANGPISIIAMIAFYLAVFSSSMPNSWWSPYVKYLPISSAFAMPVNIINGSCSLCEILLSLIILIASSLWLLVMSIKVYKHVIFNYGNRTTFKDVLRIIFLIKE